MSIGPRSWLVAFCLSGVALACIPSATDLADRDAVREAVSSGTTSVVVGRIRWLEHGVEKKIGGGLVSFSITPMLLRMEDRSRSLGELEEDGRFVWTLEPGTYVINRINYRDPWSGNYFVVPQVAFRVPEAGQVYYLGTLRADFAKERDLIGGLGGDVSVLIEDEARGDHTDVARAIGVEPGSVVASLMVHAEDLPRTIDTTAEFQLAMQVLNAVLYGLSQ